MSSWRKYGGTNAVEKSSDIRVNSFVSNYFTILKGITNDVDISGNLTVSSRLNVYRDVSFNKNLSISGYVNIAKDLEIFGQVDIHNNQMIDGNLTVLDHLYFQTDINNHYMYGSEAGIAINKHIPEAELDICGNQQCVLNVKSTMTNTNNILCRNKNDQSIMLSIDDLNATVGFFYDNSLNMTALAEYPDAKIQYTKGGTMTIDASSHIQIINNLIVSDISTNVVQDSVVTVYNENTDKIFLYDSYNVKTARNSNSICNVAVDNSSNVGINLITKYNQYGAAIYGGVYPKNTKRKMMSFGTTDFSNHSYVPAQTIVSGSSNVVCKNTTGINRCTPKVDKYAMDVNGPIHIENIDITTAANVPFQLTTMRFSKKYPNYGIAAGGVYKYSNNTDNEYYSQQAYITTNGASSWIESSFVINGPNPELQSMLTSYVYNNYMLIYGGTGVGFYFDISNNTWYSKNMQSFIDGGYSVIDMFITDCSGNKSEGNLSTIVFFIMESPAKDQYQLRIFNAAFGENGDYYNNINKSLLDNNDYAKYVLYKENKYTYTAGGSIQNSYEDNIIGDNVSLYERIAINGRCLDGCHFPIETNPGEGYIYIAGEYDINKYNYSEGGNNLSIMLDCSHIPQTAPKYNAISVYDLSYVVAVGFSLISYTKDGGLNWTDISRNTSDLIIEGTVLRSVYVYDLSNAIAVGDHNTMIYTTDGTTWKNIPPTLLDLSGSGFPLIDASLNDIFIFNKNAFVLSSRISSFEMNADVSNIGNAKIVYNYVPDLMNGANNSVLDICGNMTIGGNIIIDNGNISTTSNNLYISSNTPYTYIGDGIGSNKVSIGNKNGSVVINSNFDLSYNMKIDGTDGLTITNGNINMINGAVNAKTMNIDKSYLGVVNIDGGTESNRDEDSKYALHVAGYRPAVRIDASMGAHSLYVDNESRFKGDIISTSSSYPALLVQNATAVFEHGLDIESSNGVLTIDNPLPVSLDRLENGAFYLRNGTNAKIDGNMFIMKNMYIQGVSGAPSLTVGTGQSQFNSILVNGPTTLTNTTVNGTTYFANKVDISGNVDMSGNLKVRGNITYTGTSLQGSDYRIKTNVIPLYDTSFNVDKIEPVYYYNTVANADQIGFIAHRLQEQYPFLVSGVKDGPELQTVNYIGIIGVLVQEIKDLKERVKKLENR